ncbi:CBS domain-containing protein [Methanocaldococcus infernus]|uniref:Signal transduction protein with CBS domains n=1 Tax=Methanocaldococcus infernus (strain DSM 11812 / JCM 15783 / ME) TaxID=573063 RepID=D5VQS8_METIM|nr:CBS domain-containing protein [Methanocaldococcus infernus]ADG12931.1 putative signal transduction protein with CBS domains [Methanocaldococcus infernus ME]
MELTVIQKEILSELINLYREKNRPIKGTEIALRLKRNPGTIRNQMQALRALDLVDGVPGPKGGYIPTSKAYRALGIEDEGDIIVPIYKNNVKIDGVKVIKIEFDTVSHEKSCSSKIYIEGDTKKFNVGDIIKVGPTYHNKIVITGEVIGRDDIHKILLMNVYSVCSIPNLKVSDIGNPLKYYLTPNMSLKEAAEYFAEKNISGAPVMENNNLVGILTVRDIIKNINKIDKKVKEVMKKDIITVDKDVKIYDALKIMNKYNVGRLIIVDNNKVFGIITRTDILKTITGELYQNL